MPREIWNEGRVVGLSAYELYVKQHLSEDPDTPVATEREWLASSLGMGSSMILKMPNVNQDSTSYQEYYVDIPLPADSRLAAANSIVATFFEGEIEMQDTYWAKKVTSYGPLITNALVNNEDPEYQLKLNPISDLGYTIPDYKTTSNLRYIYLGGCIGTNSVPKYEVSSEVDVSTGVARLVDPEIIELTLGVDLSGKYIKLYDQIGQIEPNPIFKQGYIIKVPDSTDETKDLFVYTQWLCIRCEQLQYVTVKTLEGTHPALEGYVSTTDDVLPDSNGFYVENRTNGHSPGTAMNDWQKTTRAQLSDYLKIMDGIVIQPGTWTETETPPPTSDFEVDLKNRPRIRLRVHGQITTNPLILLTGFTVRYVLCGTLGQDTALDTPSYADGDFLGPAIFPWCNKILFTVPSSYIDFFERDYLNTSIESLQYTAADISVNTDAITDKILGNKPVVYFVQDARDEYEYFKNRKDATDEKLFIQGGISSESDSNYITRKYNRSQVTLDVSDHASLNNKQSVFLIYSKNSKFPPSLYSGSIVKDGETSLYPVDISSPGSVKMFHETSYDTTTTVYGDREDAPVATGSEYETYYPGTNSLMKKYDDGTVWTIDNKKVGVSDSYVDSSIPIAKVDNYDMKGFIANSTDTAPIYNPGFTPAIGHYDARIRYKVVTAGRDSITALPFGENWVRTRTDGVHDDTYLMSTIDSPSLEYDTYSDEDYINWYDMIRALAGNRKIDLLGKALREFKKSLADSKITFSTYKLNCVKEEGSIWLYPSSGQGPGPNDYYIGYNATTVGWKNDDTRQFELVWNSRLFDSIKMDIYGYTQTYNDGTYEDIHDTTYNYLVSLKARVTKSGNERKYSFNQTNGHYEHKCSVQALSGFKYTDTSESGTREKSVYSDNATITLNEYKEHIGVNSWIQGIKLNDSANVMTLMRILQDIAPKKYYTNGITQKKDSTLRPYILNSTFPSGDTSTYVGPYTSNSSNPQTKSICRIDFNNETGDVFIYSSLTGRLAGDVIYGTEGKPSSGTYYRYIKGSTVGSTIADNAAKIVVEIFRDKNDGVYKANVTAMVPDTSIPVNAVTFVGRAATYGSRSNGEVHGDVTLRFDVSGLWGVQYSVRKWYGIDFDHVSSSSMDGYNSFINGYIQGKADGDTFWNDLSGSLTVTGGVSVDSYGIANDNFKSQGTVVIDNDTINIDWQG